MRISDWSSDVCSSDLSTGALGYRKFPNPRFDREAWLELNGSLASWDGYSRQMSDDPASADTHVRRLAADAIEPPFLIGTTCGACQIAFHPLNHPKDPTYPDGANIKHTITTPTIKQNAS